MEIKNKLNNMAKNNEALKDYTKIKVENNNVKLNESSKESIIKRD